MPENEIYARTRKYLGNDLVFAFLVATIAVVAIFSVYLGQELYSDVMTFQKNGDQLKLTFPAFIQAGKVLFRPGVDTGIFNGATEIVLRSNLPMYYPPFVLFSLLGSVTTYGFAYLAFYAVQMLAFVFFGILTTRRFFLLERKYACLCTLCSLVPVLCSSWYTSFYIAATLVWPMLYFSLSALEEKSKLKKSLLYSIPYVLGALSGYITVSVYLCIEIFAFTAIYDRVWKQDGVTHTFLKSALRSIPPAATAAVVVFPYFYQVLVYAKKVVQNAGSSLNITFGMDTGYTMYPKDFINFFSYAFTKVAPNEGNYNAYIGLAWLFLIISVVIFGEKAKIASKKRRFTYIVFFLASLQLLTCVGTYTPLQGWFYSAVPVLGAMHLPARYLLVLMPLVFLALTITYSELEQVERRSTGFALLLTGCAIAGLLLNRAYGTTYDANILLVELILFFVFLISARKCVSGIPAIAALIACTLCMPLMYSFYTELSQPASTFESRSVVYSEGKQQQLNKALSQLPEKNLYKYIAFENETSVPEFIPGNLEWYNLTEKPIVNYSGYEPHLSTPKDYLSCFPWFSSIDWSYVANTRGDFAILNPETIAAQPEQYDTLLDQTYEGLYLDAVHRVYRLKQFVPKHYTGEDYVVDSELAMDNGYFYCPALAKAVLLSFETDKRTCFVAKIRAENETEVEFCLYPNRYYKYYVDGTEVEPVLEDMQAFIPMKNGTHIVTVRYENAIGIFTLFWLSGFAVLVLACSVKIQFDKRRGKN